MSWQPESDTDGQKSSGSRWVGAVLEPALPAKRRREGADDGSATADGGAAPLADLVLPGSLLNPAPGYLRGHGTLENKERTNLSATVFGRVCRVNKLVSVRPLKARYVAEIGDVVVGRITEVGLKRWKVDINAHQNAALMLSAITLPGGVQRRRTTADQLQMRNFFVERDLISAEVQQVFSDGVFALHTRNLRYGKLEHGIFAAVPCALIKRCPSHFHRLSCGVHVILGNNGYVWISPFTSGQDPKNAFLSEEALLAAKPDPSAVSRQTRERVCRVRNCVMALAKEWVSIHPASIMETYEASADYPLHDLLRPDVVAIITRPAQESQQAQFVEQAHHQKRELQRQQLEQSM